ncbi:hypothetical protein IFM89_031435 [Coptis chinensis]|uniref:Uncharacterized protein n=1 Tax=Coptis chinensis TaxID=261450 RepID=A0A835HI52_9MAGN|nr:hypothetical protein IFM89_031435 [Coptis chinensis]
MICKQPFCVVKWIAVCGDIRKTELCHSCSELENVCERIYNVVDDDPASCAEVFAFAHTLIEKKWPGQIKTRNYSDMSESEINTTENKVQHNFGVETQGITIHAPLLLGLVNNVVSVTISAFVLEDSKKTIAREEEWRSATRAVEYDSKGDGGMTSLCGAPMSTGEHNGSKFDR